MGDEESQGERLKDAAENSPASQECAYGAKYGNAASYSGQVGEITCDAQFVFWDSNLVLTLRSRST
jgi:hypothetical protein